MDFREGTVYHGIALGKVTYNMRGEHLGVLGTGFQGEGALKVRRNADGGTIEINTGKGDRLSVLCIYNTAFHAGQLRRQHPRNHQEEQR